MKYEIRDPWPIRLRERLNLALVCSWRGHDRPQKMYGAGACNRCGR